MSLVFISNKKLIRYPFKHDPSDEKYYTFVWKAPTWGPLQEYLLDSIVKPSSVNGFYYVCVNPGISSLTEPTFPTIIGKTVSETSGLQWQAVAYNLNMVIGDTITDSSWKITDNSFNSLSGITISDISESEGITFAKISITDSTIPEFILTNSVTILRDSGKTEKYERSILISVGNI